ncbi:unnamed protein product [Ectocarpus sp. 12 AP-2014]
MQQLLGCFGKCGGGPLGKTWMAGAGGCSCCAFILVTDHACGSFSSNVFSRKVLFFALITGGVDSRMAEKRAVFLYIPRVSV